MEKFQIEVELTPKQKSFLQAILLYNRILYGGQAGGGKSFGVMIIAGILMDMFPGVTIRAIRESFSAVEQNLVAKFKKIYPEKNKKGQKIYKYNKSDNIVTWHNGSQLIFDYCANLTDAMNKQGLEQDILIIDEVVSHQEDEIRYLINRTRSNIPEIGGFGKVIFTGNPIGPGLNYIRKEYVEATEFGKYYATKISRSVLEEGRIYKITHAFIEASLKDNKYLMDTGYEANILELNATLQKVFLSGDWFVSIGAHFSNFDSKYHVYKKGEIEIQPHWKKSISMDWGINDYTALYWYAVDEKGMKYVYREYYQNNRHIEDVAQIILDLTSEDFEQEIDHMIVPHDLFRRQVTAIRNEDGVVIGETPAEVLQELLPYALIKADASKGSRKRGWRACHKMLYLDSDDKGFKHPRIAITENAPNLITQLKTIESDITDFEEIRPNQEDHAVDSFRYYCDTTFTSEKTYVPKAKPKEGTPEYTKELIANKRGEDDDSSAYY